MMYLGLDLGTGLAKLARCPAGTRSPATGVADITVVPTAVIYRGLASEIPVRGAAEMPPGVVRCDGFPMMLDAALSASRVAAWRSRTPGEVTQGFLRCLLDALDGVSRSDRPGEEPAELVVAVPPAGRNQRGTGDGRNMGAEVRDILAALGHAPRRLIAAPVAALLKLRSDDADLAAATHYVIFDGGTGSVELSLCTADDQGIRVADSMRLTGISAWGDDTLAFADASDRPPTLAECLITALAAVAGTRATPTAGPASVIRWRALERALADDDRRDRLDAVLQQASAARHRHGGTVALRFADLEVTAAQLIDACEPFAQRTVAALSRLLGRQEDPTWLRFGPGNGTRLVLTGGLSALQPLRTVLIAAAGLDPEMPGGAVVQLGNADRIGAVARGAALIASGQADPGDRYPHALRLVVNHHVRDRIVPAYLELAAPGSIDLDMDQTVFLAEGNDPVLVTVRPTADPPGSMPIPVQLVPRGGGPAVPAAFHLAAPPEPGVYRVGVRGGPAGPAVVLQHADGGEALTYTLAEPADRAAGRPAGQVTR